jgi:sugar lactone lactonase YvrE
MKTALISTKQLKLTDLTFSLIILFIFTLFSCNSLEEKKINHSAVRTIAGIHREFGEPFGLAFDQNGTLYVSDGESGQIKRVSMDGKVETVTDKLQTPSAIAFDKDGFLVVADSGASNIKRVNVINGEVTIVAGAENRKGFADGESSKALFNAPIGLAVTNDGKIYVSDTYNDKIRLIENGRVSTLAGSEKGVTNGIGAEAEFDTPCGLAIWSDGSLLVADTGNRLIRRVEPNGNVTTLAGNGEPDWADGFPLQAKMVEPTALTVDKFGAIYIADGNSIRVIGKRFFPYLETISNDRRGIADGKVRRAKFNRPSGLAFDKNGNLFVTDSENQLIRVLTDSNLGKDISKDEITKLRYTAQEFPTLQPPRWPYNPPDAKRDVAGTLGEIRGEIRDDKEAWFHNGLDIAGGYGEKAYFIRTEKVLRPIASENFGGLRELLRMPTIGYIHLRLGRDKDDNPFGDSRFQFERDAGGLINADSVDKSGKITGQQFQAPGKIVGIRVPRGTRFEAGDALGTLNSFNHVHLIAGRSGAEMNALEALVFPNIEDKVAPIIEKVTLFDENWNPVETEKPNQRIKLSGKIRVVARAFDQMNGNAARRRLGVYRLGYQILKDEKTPLFEPKWTISFQNMPDSEFVKIVYAKGSQSGYTPETIFNYIVTNELGFDSAKENFLDLNQMDSGNYILRVLASDLFGNTATSDTSFELVK